MLQVAQSIAPGMTGGKGEGGRESSGDKGSVDSEKSMPTPKKARSRDRSYRFWVQSPWQKSWLPHRPHLAAEIFVKSRFIVIATVLLAGSAILLRAHASAAGRED